MQDGSRQSGQGLMLATNSFTKEDCLILANILNEKFGLKTSVIKAGHKDQYKISIWKASMPKLSNIIGDFIIFEMRYKLSGYL